MKEPTTSTLAAKDENPVSPSKDAEGLIHIGFGAGLHTAAGQSVDVSAYERYLGRWSRLFVPSLLDAAKIRKGDRVLDVATGPGEAAMLATARVGSSGVVIGVDVSPAMLKAARVRINENGFLPAAMDGQLLAFGDDTFDAVVCQLGLQFFSSPGQGLAEFHRVLRAGRYAALCVVSTADRAPMWGVLAEALSRELPEHRDTLHLSFALADPEGLERLFALAGFSDVSVWREIRECTFDSFDDYWAPIEAGIGQLPQAYLALPASGRIRVLEEVQTRLTEFESGGRLVMSVEMLIGTCRA